MKRRIILAGILFSGTLFTSLIFAQETVNEERKVQSNKELKMVQEAMQKQQQAMTLQKEEMAKRSHELSKQFEKQERERRERDFFYGRMPEPPAPVWSVYSSDKSATLSLHKNFKEESATKKATFIVDENAKQIRFKISGSCHQGSIQIKINLPSGKAFYSVDIDPSADISWSQSLKVEEGNKKYTGVWNVEIKATKVNGSYSFSVSTM